MVGLEKLVELELMALAELGMEEKGHSHHHIYKVENTGKALCAQDRTKLPKWNCQQAR